MTPAKNNRPRISYATPNTTTTASHSHSHRSVATPQPMQAAKEPQRVMPHISVKTKVPVGSLYLSKEMNTPARLNTKTPIVVKPLNRMMQTPNTIPKYPHNTLNTATKRNNHMTQSTPVVVNTKNNVKKCDKENDLGVKKNGPAINPFMEIIDSSACI